MKTTLSLLFCGLFLSGNAFASESGFRADLLATLQIYAKQNNLGLDKPTDNFMGFSITPHDSGNSVTVYHADSPVDVIINDYVCSESGCELVARNPRCFYYTPGGSHSALAIYNQAILLSEKSREWKIHQLKFWQLGELVYGRISDITTANNELYVCRQYAKSMDCESVSELPDEP
ncbi:hypothetical protein [Bdellovibrio sp. HCB274]|uniref:hypothetical protein n=1 Tax=Bdellovibrio sp. HCB274 TaxID=3394361 RepID=UPI0039B6A5D2